MHPSTRVRDLFASDDGTFNLSSIIIGAVLVLGLVAGLTVGLTRLLPWGQDMNAKEDLSAVRTAESVTRAKDGRFLDDAGLKTAGLVDVVDRAVVGTNTEGTCYVAVAKSRSGKFFFTTDTNSGYEPLVVTTHTGDCLDIAADEQLRLRIGAPIQSFGPLLNGSFEEGLNHWTTGGTPVVSTGSHQGVSSLRLPRGSYIEQAVRLPAGAVSLNMVANYISDAVTVSVYGRSGAHLGDYVLSAGGTTGTWRHLSADLSAHAGKDVTLRFSPRSNAEQIDAISLQPVLAAAPTKVKGYTVSGGAVIDWSRSAQGMASVTSQIATAYVNGEAVSQVTVPPTETRAVFSGLNNGVKHTFTVKSVNVLGAKESAHSPEYLVHDHAILNAGFEGGFAEWTVGVVNNQRPELQTSSGTHTGWPGAHYVRILGDSYIEQVVTVPDGDGRLGLQATAVRWGGYTSTVSQMKVQAFDLDGTLLGSSASGNASSSPGIILADMTAFRGKTVLLRIGHTGTSSNGVQIADLRFAGFYATTAPTITNSWMSDGTAHIQWNPPVGKESVTSYRVTATLNGTVAASKVVPASELYADVTGLENGRSYQLQVAATNGIGESPFSAQVAVVPQALVVFNGGFELGMRGWSVSGTPEPVAGSARKDTGVLAAEFRAGSGYAEAPVSLPVDGTVTLQLRGQVNGGLGSRDTLKISVLDRDGTLLAERLLTVMYSWGTHNVDLTAFKGQDVTIRIGHANANGYSHFVDNVSITAR